MPLVLESGESIRTSNAPQSEAGGSASLSFSPLQQVVLETLWAGEEFTATQLLTRATAVGVGGKKKLTSRNIYQALGSLRARSLVATGSPTRSSSGRLLETYSVTALGIQIYSEYLEQERSTAQFRESARQMRKECRIPGGEEKRL